MSQPEKLSLPWWMSGVELTKIKNAGQEFFDYLKAMLEWPLDQLDIMKADIGIVNLYAWQRGVTRFTDEPETLFRQRTRDAYANASDAGSVVGFGRIAERLGMGYLEQLERQPDKDWDVVVLKVPSSFVSNNHELMDWLVATYGRTCRRYEWLIITQIKITEKIVGFYWDQQTLVASLPFIRKPGVGIRPCQFSWNQQTMVAKSLSGA